MISPGARTSLASTTQIAYIPPHRAAMIEIICDQSDENIVVARVATTVGTILVMAEVELTGRS